MTEPRTRAQAGEEPAGLQGSRADPAAPGEPLSQAISPGSSPASRPQRAASPSADDRGAPGTAAAPSRARPVPSPRPGGASAGPAGSGPRAPRPGPRSAELRAPARAPGGALPALGSPGGRARRGRGARYGRRGAGAGLRRSGAGTQEATPPRSGPTCGPRKLRLRALAQVLEDFSARGSLAPPDFGYPASGPQGRGSWDPL